MTAGHIIGLMWTLGPLLAAAHLWHKFDLMIKRDEDDEATESERDVLRTVRLGAQRITLPGLIILASILFWPIVVLAALAEYGLIAVWVVILLAGMASKAMIKVMARVFARGGGARETGEGE